MDFNELNQSYTALQQQLASRAITLEYYQQEVAKLRFMTPDGVWWQINPVTGGWLTWNGQAWIPATVLGQSVQQQVVTEMSQPVSAERRRHSRRPPPKQQPAPQTLWQLVILMVKSWRTNLPATVVSSIVTAGATWFLHTWLLVGPTTPCCIRPSPSSPT